MRVLLILMCMVITRCGDKTEGKEDEKNACGGFQKLEHELGEKCGECGAYECDGPDAVVCNDPCEEEKCASDEDCSEGRCLPQEGICVECLGDEDCSEKENRTHCETTTHKCVTCTKDSHCADTETPLCNTDTGVCVECIENIDCEKGICSENGRCLVCDEDFECEATEGCDVSTGQCVQRCTSDADCISWGRAPYCRTDGGGTSPDGCVQCLTNEHCGNPNLYCDPEDNTCEPVRRLCESCTIDEECAGEGSICHPEYNYCGAPCEDNSDCPRGYICENILDPETSTSIGVNCIPTGLTCEYFDTIGTGCYPEAEEPCGEEPNTCHDFITDDPVGPYCTVSCNEERDCPEEFFCNVLINLCMKEQ